MAKTKKALPTVTWKDAPEEHDYPAAYRYLSLHMAPDKAHFLTLNLQRAKMTSRANKDLLRAAGLTLLPIEDAHVQKNLRKIAAGKPMVPILVVVTETRTYIADGYHRCCAVWHLNYDEEMPCQIVWAKKSGPAQTHDSHMPFA